MKVAPSFALITGGSSGIGLAFARQLAFAGQNLVLVSRDDNLSEVAENLAAEFGVKVEALRSDLSVRTDLEKVVARIESEQKPVEILVNCAGFVLHESLVSGDLARQHAAFAVMAEAILRLSQAAASVMKRRAAQNFPHKPSGEKQPRKFQIINIASTSAWFFAGNYSAIKRWVVVYTESLALELGGSGVTATAVCPGETATDFHAHGGLPRPGIPQWLWCRPEQIARAGLRAAARGKSVYVPTVRWRLIVFVLKHWTWLARRVSRGLLDSRIGEAERHAQSR